ncbi:hypothetical protein GF351_01525 [Candidatus Woesearchaeota archaeon]|nr:hypothetical protein [Candidatus Woesearchaeota archaeon]
MEYKNIYSFEINWKTLTLLSFLAIFPNLLGMLNIPTVWGFKIHLFQYLIFIAAAVYGPVGGMISGGFGSLFTAMTLGNPYILVGNMILGFAAGFLFRKGLSLILAGFVAWAVHMPYLWLTDVYLAGMPVAVVNRIVIALLICDLVWALAARYTYKPIQRAIQ